MQNIKKLSRKSHKKFKLLCHLIFSTKYRQKLFANSELNSELNSYLKISLNHKFKGFKILISETDKDHIHFMISYKPEISISKIVQQLKSYTTFHLWKRFGYILRKYYWKEPCKRHSKSDRRMSNHRRRRFEQKMFNIYLRDLGY